MDETIQQTIAELYGVELSEPVQTYRGVQFGLGSRPEQRYLLRPAGCPVHRTVFTYACMHYLSEKYFTGVELYLLTKDGLPYILLGNTPYVAVPIYKGRECSMENGEDVCRGASALAKLHLASQGFTQAVASSMVRKYSPAEYDGDPFVRVDAGRLPGIFTRRFEELKRFQRMARKSANRFDCAYSAIAQDYIQRADAICQRLSSGIYDRVSAHCREEGAICHKDYTGHNIVFEGRNTMVLNFDQCSIDLPVCDLANLMKRRMRKCGWVSEDGWRILQAYHRVRPLSEDEIVLLQLILGFPQKLWRIVNKYYNSRKTWCEKNCLMKLDEILAEQKSLDIFLKDLDNRFPGVYH